MHLSFRDIPHPPLPPRPHRSATTTCVAAALRTTSRRSGKTASAAPRRRARRQCARRPGTSMRCNSRPLRSSRMKASSIEGRDPHRAFAIEANAVRRFHVARSGREASNRHRPRCRNRRGTRHPSRPRRAGCYRPRPRCRWETAIRSATTRAAPSGITRMMRPTAPRSGGGGRSKPRSPTQARPSPSTIMSSIVPVAISRQVGVERQPAVGYRPSGACGTSSARSILPSGRMPSAARRVVVEFRVLLAFA